MYAVAAGAAGVSVLALSQSATAKVVYTPANVRFGLNQQSIYQIDLNHDGITDFTLWFAYSAQTANFTSSMRVGVGPNSVWRAVGSRMANATKAGTIIGGGTRFCHWKFDMGYVKGTLNHGNFIFGGLWEKHGKGVKNRYLGLRFMIDGKPHFGWARLTVTGGYPFSAKLTGYAYQTIPNKPILAGQTKGPDEVGESQPSPTSLRAPSPVPATLGLLATGAQGLSIWRRKGSAP